LKQLTQIERRQSRICQIRSKLTAGKNLHSSEVNPTASLSIQYHIGKSQNESEVIPVFLQKHAGDPAVKVSRPVAYAIVEKIAQEPS
jgi:hypothetical protein